jgi:acetyltransferase
LGRLVTAEERIIFEGTPIVLRPIHPGDEKAHREFLESLRPEDFRRRFFEAPHPYGADELWRYTHPDPSRESAFIAIEDKCEGRVLGVARAVRRKDPDRAEFAVVVRSDLKGHGLGSLLLDRLIRNARGQGIAELEGETLASNSRMLHLARDFGFEIGPPVDGLCSLRLRLAEER